MIDWQLEIPGVKLESANQSLRGITREAMYGKAAKTKQQRTGVAMCLSKFGVAPAPPLTITITRVGPRELDGDNLQGSCKHVRDGVSDWLGVNDRDKRLRWEYAQEANGKVYAVKVRVDTWVQTFEEYLIGDKAYQALRAKSKRAFEKMNRGEVGHKWQKLNQQLCDLQNRCEARYMAIRREWEAEQ